MTEHEKAEEVLKQARQHFYREQSSKKIKANKAHKDSWLDDVISLIGINPLNEEHRKHLEKENSHLQEKFKEEVWEKIMANDHDYFRRLSRRMEQGPWKDKYFDAVLNGDTKTNKVLEELARYIDEHKSLPTVNNLKESCSVTSDQWAAVLKETDLGGKLPKNPRADNSI